MFWTLRYIALWAFLATSMVWAGPFGRVPGLISPCPASYALLTPNFEITTSEATLAHDYHDRVRPFFDAAPIYETLGAGGHPLKYRVFPAQTSKELGSIVIAHGYTESMKKWAETVFNLTENGYRVYIFDYRGHGETPRLTEHPFMVYTDRFRDYVDDMSLFVDGVVMKDSHLRLGLMGYSMGGLISAMYASEHPGAFGRVGLAAPMMGVRLKGVPRLVVEIAAKVMSRMGFAKRYALGQSEKWVAQDPFGVHTHSEPRYQLQGEQMEAEPEIQTGGASFGWVATALEAVKQRNRVGRASTDNTLVVIGSQDKVIPEKDILKYCVRHQDCKVHYVDGGHNLFHEVDPVRQDLLFRMMEHFASQEPNLRTPQLNAPPSQPPSSNTAILEGIEPRDARGIQLPREHGGSL